MSVEEKLDAGYEVAPDYGELKRVADQAFKDIPKREPQQKIKKDFIIDELNEDASQGNFKADEIAKDQIAEDQEQAPAKLEDASDYELLEEMNQFGFTFRKEKDGKGMEIIKSQS